MINPLLLQFQNWINQLESAPPTSFSEQLAQWQQWVSKLQSNAAQLSPNHSSLVEQVSLYSQELIELLAELTRSQARGADTETLIQQLRAELHKFNLRHTLEQATLPHQFLGLLFTQQQPQFVLSDLQTDQLKQTLVQLKHPGFIPLKQFVQALIEWQQASQQVHQGLEQISQKAIERFLAHTDTDLEQEAILNLWVDCYDTSYRDAFNTAQLQQAQAALVNALAQLHLTWQGLTQQFTEQLGLPSASQIDQLIDQLDQQRRRIRKLEVELEQLKARQES